MVENDTASSSRDMCCSEAFFFPPPCLATSSPFTPHLPPISPLSPPSPPSPIPIKKHPKCPHLPNHKIPFFALTHGSQPIQKRNPFFLNAGANNAPPGTSTGTVSVPRSCVPTFFNFELSSIGFCSKREFVKCYLVSLVRSTSTFLFTSNPPRKNSFRFELASLNSASFLLSKFG